MFEGMGNGVLPSVLENEVGIIDITPQEDNFVEGNFKVFLVV